MFTQQFSSVYVVHNDSDEADVSSQIKVNINTAVTIPYRCLQKF